jgi:small subunit ribosomal protein S17
MAERENETPEVEPEAAAEATPEPEVTPEAEQPAEADAPAEAEAPEQAVAEPAEPVEVLAPKERRRRARAAKAAQVPPLPARTPEERQEERAAERRRKADLRRAQRQRSREKASAGKGAAVATQPREHVPGRQKTRQGVVVSDRADKTITVRIDITRRHPRYAKIVRTSNTLHAHDELNDAHIGDTVLVREARPLSRSKRWRLIEVVQRAE